MDQAPTDITQLLKRVSAGDPSALSDLYPLVYVQLHRMAGHFMQGERREHTLQTTALVNEAYLKLIDQRQTAYQDRGHFFAISARIMRQILTDHARHRTTVKGGRGWARLDLDQNLAWTDEQSPFIEALDEALSRLEQLDERQGKIVEMRFFGGMSEEEIATALGVHVRTVRRDWAMARAWLYGELRK